jgi:hypothetical protein
MIMIMIIMMMIIIIIQAGLVHRDNARPGLLVSLDMEAFLEGEDPCRLPGDEGIILLYNIIMICSIYHILHYIAVSLDMEAFREGEDPCRPHNDEGINLIIYIMI